MMNCQVCILLFALYISGIHTTSEPLDTVNINLNIDESNPSIHPRGAQEQAAVEVGPARNAAAEEALNAAKEEETGNAAEEAGNAAEGETAYGKNKPSWMVGGNKWIGNFSQCHTMRKQPTPELRKAMESLDVEAVKEDIKKVLTDSQDFWPADYGNYGPFFIRMAWHMSGTYRQSDGRGGIGGGRQRFEPESKWEDNANLDKARRLLEGIKKKYGDGLSYGDLYVLTANVALDSMGHTLKAGFCGGRIDDDDGSDSRYLGPTAEQKVMFPCKDNVEELNGACEKPLGTKKIGLIYVNPEGPLNEETREIEPIPEKSVVTIRDVFGRMGMNDSETVALIGGGHTFGKVHGACTPKNMERRHYYPNGWYDESAEPPCGEGKGINAYSSGFEFPWTTKPLEWDQGFFKALVKHNFTNSIGPGGKNEWKAVGKRPQAPAADGNGTQDTGMLTTDIALKKDKIYWELVQKFAKDRDAFDFAWFNAWYKLTTRDMGPRSRCIGNNVPPAQPWQFPLPESSSLVEPDHISKVRADIEAFLVSEGSGNDTWVPREGSGDDTWMPREPMINDTPGLLIRLVWNSASTYRVTDFLGGTNGARIRFSPQKDWPMNRGLEVAFEKLKPIKDKYKDDLSWADLTVLASYVAIEKAGGRPMKFCPGRSDAEEEDGMSKIIFDPDDHNMKRNMAYFNGQCEAMDLLDLSPKEWSVLHAAGYAIGQANEDRNSELFFRRDARTTSGVLSNVLFRRSLKPDSQWTVRDEEHVDLDDFDRIFREDDYMREIAKQYAANDGLFLKDFAAVWTKITNYGSFDGPFGTLCESKGRF